MKFKKQFLAELINTVIDYLFNEINYIFFKLMIFGSQKLSFNSDLYFCGLQLVIVFMFFFLLNDLTTGRRSASTVTDRRSQVYGRRSRARVTGETRVLLSLAFIYIDIFQVLLK